MRRYTSVLFLIVSTVSAASEPEHVILISIDGLPAYHLENPEVELPNIRTLIETGVWAESSETVYPSVTHPSHTTILTGVSPRAHGVVGNRVVNRETGERFHFTNKPHGETVKVPTIFDAAKKKGLVTASFYWPENYRDPSVDYCIPEVFDGDAADPRAADPTFLEELRRADVPIDLFYEWYLDQARKGVTDAILADAAAYVIKEYQPHLLAIHFLVTDELQHTYGPDHYRAKEALTAADHAVGIVRRAIDEAGLSERTTFFIVSDHGFHTVGHEVNVYPVFARHRLDERVRLHEGGWSLFVEALDLARDKTSLEKAFVDVTGLDGIDQVLRPEDFHELGYPRYDEDPHVRGQYAILGDIDTFPVADRESKSTARRRRKEPYHGHGYVPTHPRMYPALVVSGSGVRRGIRIGHVRNVDIAPTIAALLGLSLPDTEGVVLEELLQEK